MAKYKHLDGASELEAALKELQNMTGKSGKPVLRRALVKSSLPIRDGAREMSPWPDTEDENNIKAGTAHVDGTGKRSKGREPKNAVYSYVFDPHPLAAIFEYGTDERVQSTTGRETGKIEPHGYMRKATEDNFENVIQSQGGLIGAEIKKAMDKHVKK